MPNNRTVTLTGIFAQNASTVIPANPVAGSPYRNASMTPTEIQNGWPFKTIVDSSNFNQTMYELSSLAKQFEQYGFLPWSNLTDYPIGGFALGSNGSLYQALQATGPSTTSMDPTTDTNHTYWQVVQFGTHTGMVSPYGGSVAPDGWLICDGSAVSRTTYSALFAVIGTTYGAGDGSTTFNIPNISSIVKSVNTNVPCKGNGIGLGITEGTHLAGVRNTTSGLAATQNAYGTDIGTSTGTTSNLTITKTVGLTTDSTKSGIVGTVTRSVLSINFAIKY